jgi:phosphonate transport system permease protein
MTEQAAQSLLPSNTRTGRRWSRFTPLERAGRLILLVVLVAAVVMSIRHVEVIPEFLWDAPAQMQDLLSRMWPIDWPYYWDGVHEPLLETIHIATLGTIIAIVLATPIGVLSAGNIVRSKPWNLLARLTLVGSRSVNSLIWALLFVGVFGPGALAGTIAIAFRSIGFVGKLIGEALEECDPKPIEALRATGASSMTVLLKAYWPQIAPTFWSVALFRWDINVRESAVLGLVGAGGIGMALDTTMNLFQWDRVSLILASIFVIVLIAEVVVTQVRKRII